MLRQSTLRSPQLKKKKRKLLAWKAGASVAALGLLVFGLSALSRMDAIVISEVEVSGNKAVTAEQIKAVVDRSTDGDFYRIFSKRNIFLYPKKQVLAAIAESFPIFDKVDVERSGLDALKIDVSERAPDSVWCVYDAASDAPFTDDCYLLDAAGYIYMKAPEFKGSLFFKYYGETEGDAEGPLGRTYLSEDYRLISKFVDGVKALGFTPTRLQAKTEPGSGQPGEYELHLRDGGRIVYSDSVDYLVALSNLETVIQNDLKKGPKDPQVDYIDLRLGNKIFFKLKQAAVQSIGE